jgi:hypothetical protein
VGYEVYMERIINPKLKCDLFATHPDIGQAISYAQQAINSLPAVEIPLMLTVFQSLINTIIAEEDKRDNN